MLCHHLSTTEASTFTSFNILCTSSNMSLFLISTHFVLLSYLVLSDTPGNHRQNLSSKMNESDFQSLKRKESALIINTPPNEKTPRPTSLFRMGGKLFQDGSSKEKAKLSQTMGPPPVQQSTVDNRVRSLSTTGRTSLFSATILTGTDCEAHRIFLHSPALHHIVSLVYSVL